MRLQLAMLLRSLQAVGILLQSLLLKELVA